MHRCCPSVRLSVRLSVAKMRTKNKQFFSKTKQFRAMVSIYDLSEDLHGLFIEPITGPLKFKMADGRHFANRKIIAISQQNIIRCWIDSFSWCNPVHNKQDVIKISDGHRNVVNSMQLCRVTIFLHVLYTKLSDLDEIWYTNAYLVTVKWFNDQIWKFLKYKMADGRHFKNRFWS